MDLLFETFFSKLPTLVFQKDIEGKPIHVVWGIPKNLNSPAVLITSYRPDSKYWANDFTRRKV